MPLASDRCICIRKFEYSETSQILSLFGREHGLLRLIAKGAHRVTKAGASKFSGGLDLLDLGQAVFTNRPEKDLAVLTEWRLLDGHLALRKNLRATHLAFYSAELTHMLLEEHDPHPGLFDFLQHTLDELATNRREQSLVAFVIQLLRETGYMPELRNCVSCSRPAEARLVASFDPQRGGLLCRSCEASFPARITFDPRLLSVIHSLLAALKQNTTTARLPILTRHQTDPINRLLAEYITHTLGKKPKMLRWILQPA